MYNASSNDRQYYLLAVITARTAATVGVVATVGVMVATVGVMVTTVGVMVTTVRTAATAQVTMRSNL